MSLTTAKFTVEKPLWDARVWHAKDVTCPAHLCLAHDGDDTGQFSLFQDLCVRDLVLPPDVEQVSEAAKMELLKLLLMTPVGGPGLAAI